MNSQQLLDDFIGFGIGMMALGFGVLLLTVAGWMITHW